MQIADVVLRARCVPGEDVELIVTLAGENGVETVKKVSYHVPVGAPPGLLYFTAADATIHEPAGFQSAIGAPLHSPAQVLELLNSLADEYQSVRPGLARRAAPSPWTAAICPRRRHRSR